MLKETSRQWINAMIALSQDRNASVTCPECKSGKLAAHLIPDTSSDREFCFYCENCGAKNYARIAGDRLD